MLQWLDQRAQTIDQPAVNKATAAAVHRITEAPLQALRLEDLEAAQALVEEAGWNQVRQDWELFVQLGSAFKVTAAAALSRRPRPRFPTRADSAGSAWCWWPKRTGARAWPLRCSRIASSNCAAMGWYRCSTPHRQGAPCTRRSAFGTAGRSPGGAEPIAAPH